MTTFVEYRDGCGGKIAAKILDMTIDHLRTCKEFFAFTYSVSCAGNAGPKMLERATHAYDFGHVGERVVILATLFAMDRSGHAIMLQANAGENLLGILAHADDQYRAAVAACLQLKD